MVATLCTCKAAALPHIHSYNNLGTLTAPLIVLAKAELIWLVIALMGAAAATGPL